MVIHVVAMPYPGRGHINPMMNLCHIISSRHPNTTVFTFVVTEEWLGIIGSDPKPANIRFATIPNVLPSELVRGANMTDFIDAVMTKMELPFVELLDRLDMPPKVIIADTFLPWAVDVGNQRNIPVASFWTMTAAMFSIFFHFHLIVQNQHYPVELSEKGKEWVDYIPGLSPMKIADLPTILFGRNPTVHQAVYCFQRVHKAQYLLCTTVYELESEAVEALKAIFKLPVYTLGPNIPYFKLQGGGGGSSVVPKENEANYLKWLDSKPLGTVLYVSLGSFISISCAQMDEIAAGLRESRMNYLLVARGETCRLNEVYGDGGGGGEGLIVPWCDQLRVLSHSSVGGFLSHCGWNSVKESIFVGVPMLTFPLVMDQVPNNKFIVEDWKIGWKVRKEWDGGQCLVKREEIAELVRRFMDSKNEERKEMMKRVIKLKEICQHSVAEGGSSNTNINDFIRDFSS